jgi:manganese-dependent inorganic pyrophosphatase
MQTIVIGHKNPDMDAIVSAISYAEYKRLLGWKNVIAARAGAINERVAFALRKFGIEEPPFLGCYGAQCYSNLRRLADYRCS